MLRVAGLEHPAAVRSTENDDLEKKRRRRSTSRDGTGDSSVDPDDAPEDRDSLDIRA